MFQREESFFVLDSHHLEEAETRFFGYTFADGQIVEDVRAFSHQDPGPEGAWVFLRREGDRITISQDFIGSYGLYLYREGDYFAISNSFLRLVEYVRGRHPLTLNREYADYLLFVNVCSSAMGETMAREITFLDRCAVVGIQISAKKIVLREVDYRENTVDPASTEGMAILDGWQRRWAARMASLARIPGCLRADLSGGFDSRLAFALLKTSGADLSRVFIHSIQNDLYTHGEDYQIASEMAEYYGFVLNDKNNQVNALWHFSEEEILDLSFCAKLGMCKQMYYKLSRHQQRWYSVNGKGGACIRNSIEMSERQYIRTALRDSQDLFGLPGREMAEVRKSAGKVLHRTFDLLNAKYRRYGRPIPRKRAAQMLYRETRCRNHFGKQTVESFLGNMISLSPLLDPEFQRLALTSKACRDPDFLIALVFERYAPDLLRFRFEGGRSLRPDTRRRAREVSARFPYEPGKASPLPADPVREEKKPACKGPAVTIPRTDRQTVEKTLYRAFLSPSFQRLLGEAYDPAYVKAILRNVSKTDFHPLQMVCSALGAGCVLWGRQTDSPETSYVRQLMEYAAWTEEDPEKIAERMLEGEEV